MSAHRRMAHPLALRIAEPGRWATRVLVAGGGAIGAGVGLAAADGRGPLAALALLAVTYVVWTLARPEHAALGTLIVLPYLVYGASAGGLSLFLGVPMVLFVSAALVLAQRDAVRRLRTRLPLRCFWLLLAIAAVDAALSSSLSTAGSRVLYLFVYGVLAFALAASITAGRMTVRALARALVVSAALGAVALVVQFVVQFAVGQQSVVTWLDGELGRFAGARAQLLGATVTNWQVPSLNVIRAIFPFMVAPSAGQYMMLGLIATAWLWRTRPAAARTASRAAVLAAGVLIALGLLATVSRQSWVGAIIGLAALGLRRSPLRPALVILVLFLALSVIPVPGAHTTFGDYLLTAGDTSSISTGTRLGLLSQAIHLVPSHAVIGVGPGLYSTLNPDPSHPVYYAHDVWLDEAVELGVPGALALIAVFLLAMRSAFRRRAMLGFSLLAAYVVANCFDDVLYIPRNGILLGVAFALAAAGGGDEWTIRERRARRGSATRPTAPGLAADP